MELKKGRMERIGPDEGEGSDGAEGGEDGAGIGLKDVRIGRDEAD
jgi:hypothetical protein